MTNFVDNAFMQFILALPHPSVMVVFWQTVSHLTAIGSVLALFVVIFAKKENKLDRAVFYVLGLALLIMLVELVLKPGFGRLRPFIPYHFVPWTPETSFSFPSGHSTNAFYWATAIALFSPKKLWPLWLVALAIAFSRLYLGVHYFTDILAGALLGFTMALLCYTVAQKGRLTRLFFSLKT